MFYTKKFESVFMKLEIIFTTPRVIKIFLIINTHFLLSEIHKMFKYYIITQQNPTDIKCFTHRIAYTFKTLTVTFFTYIFGGIVQTQTK